MHLHGARRQLLEICDTLTLLGQERIPSPARRLDAYAHEISGGMRQRAMVALVLACNSQVLPADVPTTALDATVQARILLLLRDLQQAFDRKLRPVLRRAEQGLGIGVVIAHAGPRVRRRNPQPTILRLYRSRIRYR